MKLERLDRMTKGWFVGAFEPTLISTNDVEVAVKEYFKGDYDALHYHKLATEITVIVSGEVKMNGVILTKGDIVTIEPNEAADFEALSDAVTVVVKYPGAGNDKFMVEETR